MTSETRTTSETRPGLSPLIRALPRRAISRAVGALAACPVPAFLLTPVLALYARAYGVDLSEVAQPLRSFPTFQDFFTRRLRPGTRPLPDDDDAILSPSDSRVHAAGRVTDGLVLQAKGSEYGLDDLLGSPSVASAFEGGTYVTLYLAPGDYHRFHAPFDAEVDELRHLPGDLWPVFPRAVAALPGLLARNERIVLLGRTASGARFAYVPIGAMDVGSIRITLTRSPRTNAGGPAWPTRWMLDGVPVERGEEVGCFRMGSSLVLLLAEDGGTLAPLSPARAYVRENRSAT